MKKTVIDIEKFMKPSHLDNPYNTSPAVDNSHKIMDAIIEYVASDFKSALSNKFFSPGSDYVIRLTGRDAYEFIYRKIHPDNDTEMNYGELSYAMSGSILDTVAKNRLELRAMLLTYGYYVHIEFDRYYGYADVIIHVTGPTLGDKIFQKLNRRLCNKCKLRRCGLR